MGKFDDEMWDLNPNTIGLPSLHRPRSSKSNTVNGLMIKLFNAEGTRVKKRPKTIHVYGMDNNKVENDLLDLLSRRKGDSKPAIGPLQEKDLNISRPESAKTIDLLDMGGLLSSQSQKAVPIEAGINLLQSDHYSNELAGLVPHTSNGYEMEELQSQISTVTLENEDLITKRSVTLPNIISASDRECTRLTKSAGTVGIDEESVADSEEEPELLSTSLSSQSRKGSMSSTVNLFEQNHTFDTSILADHEKIVYNDTLIEENNSESQLTNVNIQAEDFVKDDSEVYNVEHESIELPECNMEYSEESIGDTQPRLDTQILTSTYQDPHNSNNIGDHHSQQSNTCDKTSGKVPHDISTDVKPEATDESTDAKADHTPEMVDQATPNTHAPVLPPPYYTSRERKRKTTLADICSKTNKARLPPRVGLSKKMKVDSLHDYLKK